MDNAGLYQKIIQKAPLGYACHRIICNEAGVPVDYEFVEVNAIFLTFAGLADKTVIGKRASEVLPDILTGPFNWVGFYGAIALGGPPQTFEQYSEAVESWYSIDVFSPEPGYFVTLLNDITQLKKSARELAVLEGRYHDLVETAPLCVIVAEIETQRITYANPVMLNMFGYTEQEIMQMKVLDFHPEPFRNLAFQEFQAVIQGKKTLTTDLPCQRKDGSTFIASIAAISAEIDGKTSVVGFVKDITERRVVEDAIKAERDIFIGGPIVVFLWRNLPGWPLEYVSENVEKVLGYPVEYFMADSSRYTALIHPDDKQWVRESFGAIQENESRFVEQEYRFLCADGNYRWIYYFTVPRRDESGRITHYHAYLMDMTEVRNTQEALKRQLDLEKLTSEISSSLVTVSSTNIERKMNHVLRRMGDFFNVDRAYIFQFSDDYLAMNNTYEWCAEGVIPQKNLFQGVPIAFFPWWEKQLRDKGIIAIGDSGVMPPEAAKEQQFLIEYGTRAMLCLPMLRNQELTGFIGFDAVDGPRFWKADEIGALSILNNIISDTFNRYQSDQDILYLSYHDKLTGLYNRRYFEEELKRMDTERELPLSVIIGDVNGLKITNDVFGHLAGDRLLKTIGRILGENCRDEDMVARWGGDEFVILLPRTAPEGADEICRRIQAACGEASDLPVQVSISLGYATKKNTSQAMEHILNSAEDWMYRRKLLESRSFRSAMVNSLISTLAEKSFETVGHTERMGVLSLKIGAVMGLQEDEMENLNLLSLLHDIGKVAVSERVLTKADQLNDEEWVEIQRHSEIGYRIAQSTVELGQMADLILSHHERWDGSGYPNHLQGDDIPLLSRIVAVIDAYDAMTHERPHRPQMTHEETLREIERCSGSQFDPMVVAQFLKVMQGPTSASAESSPAPHPPHPDPRLVPG